MPVTSPDRTIESDQLRGLAAYCNRCDAEGTLVATGRLLHYEGRGAAGWVLEYECGRCADVVQRWSADTSDLVAAIVAERFPDEAPAVRHQHTLDHETVRHTEERNVGERVGTRDLVLGCICMLGGVLATVSSYSAAAPGETYIVTTGLFIGGAAWLVRGLYRNWMDAAR